MEADSAVLVVGDRLYWGVQENVVRGEAFHNGVNIALSPALQGQPLRSGANGGQQVVVPPAGVSDPVFLASIPASTHMNRTRVTAGNSSVHLSGLVLHTAAVIGIR